MPSRFLSRLRRWMPGRDSAGGLVLMGALLLALLAVNGPAAELHRGLFESPLRLFIDDGLMALFFLSVGLEIKQELRGGDLAHPAQAALPGFAAAGGMAVPALIFALVNAGHPATLKGWAIPAATDIAFSLGVLRLLGGRVPAGLAVFLTALSVLDDLGAILLIGLFYTGSLSLPPLAAGLLALGGLVWLNRREGPLWAFWLAGGGLWACLWWSGLHPVLAGVALGLLLPEAAGARLAPRLAPWVAYLILPLFAFANAGLPLAGLSVARLAEPLPLGIALGLILGKPLGVCAASWAAIRWTPARLPAGAGPLAFLGTALLTGIGFTMSLFIGLLAFPQGGEMPLVRLGVLSGSLVSAVLGSLLIRLALRRKK